MQNIKDNDNPIEAIKPASLLLQAQLQLVVDRAVLGASEHILMAAGDKQMMHKDWKVPVRVQSAIDKVIRHHLRDGLRQMPTSPDSFLPYQDVIPQQIKSDIDTGSLHLIAYIATQT